VLIRVFWRREKSLTLTGNRTLDHPAHSLVTILRYPSYPQDFAMLNLQELQTSGVCTDSPPQQFHNRKLELKTENADDGEVHAEHLNC